MWFAVLKTMVHRTRPNAAALEDSGEHRLLRFFIVGVSPQATDD
jgi:hypothetical protein